MEENLRTCPTCQTPLDELDLCPRCLIANALQPTPAPSGPPPDPTEVAKAFPELEIIELVGAGGMGSVFKARQTSLDRLVALKLLPESLSEDNSFAERFQDEAKALAALNHPNIVTIHDFGQQGGFSFLLMEFVDGPNLRHLIRERHLLPEEALAIIPPLCDALQFAHDHQIVHRDIKPENLILDSKGRIKIADFGIARLIDQNLSQDLQSSGTPAYMAPEQKDLAQAVDARSDIYSLGVVLYEMLTGERPDSSLIPPSLKVDLDTRIDEVILRALATQPDQRWQSATELQTQLRTILTEDSSPPEPLTNSSPKRAWLALALTLFSLILSTFSLKSVFHNPKALLFTVPLIGAAMITGLVLGWKHLSWLKRQSIEKPALIPALTASLCWPILLLAGVVTVVIILPFNLRGWVEASFYFGLIWFLSLSIWTVCRTLAWTGNKPYPFLKHHWFFTGPILAHAVLIPFNGIYKLSQTIALEKLLLHPTPHTLYLEEQLQDALKNHSILSKGSLGLNHPDVLSAGKVVESWEDQLESDTKTNFPSSYRRVISNVVANLASEAASVEESGLGPQHPRRRAIERSLEQFETELEGLPEARKAQKPHPFFRLLPTLVLALALACLGFLIIRKARTQSS